MDTTLLLRRFLDFYPDFRERLRRKLGSVDLAEEALNEVYVKLRRSENSYSVRNVRAYLFRLTLNTAIDQHRAGARLASAEEIDEALQIADPAPDPARIAEDRNQLGTLQKAIETLTPRRRTILTGVRLEGRSCRELAEELGLSKRMVELELRQALDHCAAHMAQVGDRDFAMAAAEQSYH